MDEPPQDSETCHLCGKTAAFTADGVGWCAECLHAVGSCCGEWRGE